MPVAPESDGSLIVILLLLLLKSEEGSVSVLLIKLQDSKIEPISHFFLYLWVLPPTGFLAVAVST
jgi:hypothetical protein